MVQKGNVHEFGPVCVGAGLVVENSLNDEDDGVVVENDPVVEVSGLVDVCWPEVVEYFRQIKFSYVRNSEE